MDSLPKAVLSFLSTLFTKCVISFTCGIRDSTAVMSFEGECHVRRRNV